MYFASPSRWPSFFRRLGLRARIAVWTAVMFAAALGAAFAWGHHNLRTILRQKSDALLKGKMAELASVIRESPTQSLPAKLAEEIRREVIAHREEGLVVVLRRGEAMSVAPRSSVAEELGSLVHLIGQGNEIQAIPLPRSGQTYRILRSRIDIAEGEPYLLDIGHDLSTMETLLAVFDRRVAAGGSVFLVAAVWGGFFLSRRALEPVARSIETARLLNPADLSARLPRSGARDELDELAETMNQMLDRLADYHVQSERFTADASHELRSPLSAMRTTIEVALQQLRPVEQYRHVLESLGLQCERLSDLVNNLLLLARADAGQVDLRRELVDLTTIVDETVDLYQPVADDQEVILDWKPSDPILLHADQGRLHQLVTNLIDNALKFTDRGGSVTVRIEVQGAVTRLTVADTGIGIAADDLSRIFDRFYQADAARQGQGAGLGLSICRWIAAAHGGTIEAVSQPDLGTAMTVVLPLANGVA